MKNLIILLLCVASFCSLSNKAVAQDKPKLEVAAAKQVNSTVELTITSNKKFYVGGNVYVLYIGDRNFHLSKQTSDESGRGSITFLIPINDFNSLKEGDAIYLNYGFVPEDQLQDMSALSQENMSRCWSLGNFSKNILKK